MQKWLNTAFCILFLAVFPLSAQHSHSHTQTKQTQAAEVFSKGVIKAIDLENKKVTIEHESIEALSWPAMTMRFTFEDENLIKNLKTGESVEFSFIQQGVVSLLKSIKAI
jgi:Cu(I)/Ag(I) efflux system protein CusF